MPGSWLGAEHTAGSVPSPLPWSFPFPFLSEKVRICPWLVSLNGRSLPAHGSTQCPSCWGQPVVTYAGTTCPSHRPSEAHGLMLHTAPYPRGCSQAGKWLPFSGSRCQHGLLPTNPIPTALPASDAHPSIEHQYRGGAGRGQQLSWQDALASGAILRWF